MYVCICMPFSFVCFFLCVPFVCVCVRVCEHRYINVGLEGENIAWPNFLRTQSKNIKLRERENRKQKNESTRKSVLPKWRQRPTRGCLCYQRTMIEQHPSCLLASGFFVSCFSCFHFC